MPRTRDLLYRFRPAGAPGGAAPAGVPADRSAEASAELEPVLRALSAVERECDELLAEAQRDAGRIALRADQDELRVVREASDAAAAERTAAAAAAWDGACRDGAGLMAAAEQAAAEARRRGAERAPAYVRDVVGRVSALLEADGVRAPGGTRG